MDKYIYEINNLTFTYALNNSASLVDVNLKLEEGSFNVLCGPSGCGKTTLLKHLKPALTPHGERSGQILYAGTELAGLKKRQECQNIGYVLQNPDNQIVTDKVWHELAFGLESLGLDSKTIRLKVAEMASYFGIEKWFRKDVSQLSGGQKQLLNLASIMAMHPEVLILDEPTAQLDPIAASDFLETVRKINRDIGTTIIMTEHRLQDIVPYADNLIVMEKGAVLCQGRPKEVGRFLKDQGSGSFLSMPVPMQIYSQVESNFECPLTINEGRRWLSAITEKGEFKVDIKNQSDSFIDAGASYKNREEKPAIEAKDLWFRYEKNSPDVVKDFSLTVGQGEFFAILGGNGAGKSTALSLIAGLKNPYRGSLKYWGKSLKKYSSANLYQGMLGVLPQNPTDIFLKKTVREELELMKKDVGLTSEEELEEIAGITKIRELYDRHPFDLSGGEQQRLALAKVLMTKPQILLLDEPTKGLDAEYKLKLGELLTRLTRKNITILMVSHDIEFVAEYANRVGLFFEGNLVTEDETDKFFSGNNFYTTVTNRMARHIFPNAVNKSDLIEELRAFRSEGI